MKDRLRSRVGLLIFILALPTVALAQTEASIGDAQVHEGHTGSSLIGFPVRLADISDQPISIDYATADATATSGSDYVAASGTLIFPVGARQSTIWVTVNGDFIADADETFTVTLTQNSPTSLVVLTDVTATGTILEASHIPFAVPAVFRRLVSSQPYDCAACNIFPGVKNIHAMDLGDINGDGAVDIVYAALAGDTPPNGALWLMLNRGDGTFSEPISIDGNLGIKDVVIIDVDASGSLDVVVVHEGGFGFQGRVSVLLNDGTGAISSRKNYTLADKPQRLVVTNLNAGSLPDIAVTSYDGTGVSTVKVLWNQGGGNFGSLATYAAGLRGAGIAAADFSGDGWLRRRRRAFSWGQQ